MSSPLMTSHASSRCYEFNETIDYDELLTTKDDQSEYDSIITRDLHLSAIMSDKSSTVSLNDGNQLFFRERPGTDPIRELIMPNAVMA